MEYLFAIIFSFQPALAKKWAKYVFFTPVLRKELKGVNRLLQMYSLMGAFEEVTRFSSYLSECFGR
jgi:hypothetical protein